MFRRSPPPSRAEALRVFEALLRSRQGLELLRIRMAPGSTLEDARRLRERTMQLGRQPCSFLDKALGIERG